MNVRSLTLSLTLFVGMAAGAQTPASGGKHGKSSPQIERGRFLVSIGGCDDCHTPMTFDKELNMPVPDMSRRLSGHPEGALDPVSKLIPPDLAVISPTFTAFTLQFGTIYSINLTPDKETGLGSWTEAMFIRAMRTGKHLGGNGRPILPPMPWPALAQLPDADLKAIFAYLRSLPPIKNGVPDIKVPQEALEQIGQAQQKMMERMKPHAAPAKKP